MANYAPDIIICFIILITFIGVYLLNKSIISINLLEDANIEYHWLVQGLINILGYATIFAPGYLVYKYVKKINYLDKCGNNCFPRIIRSCFGEEELVDRTTNSNTSQSHHRTPLQDAALLTFYFFGLQISYLSWGVLQEKVMTQEYANEKGEVGHFKDSQFLVLVNRILAFCMSGMVILCSRQSRHRAPLYKYVYCSISNILSSWCQYEALKYVTFPNQVLAKAAKTIPVMIMGKIVSKTKYEYYEYVTAIILSIGMLFFMLDTGDERKGSAVTTVSGVLLLCLYIGFDSFTSNWQGKLFQQFHMSSVQMMCAVNLFSCGFTFVSLVQHGALFPSLHFMFQFPYFMVDCILLSVCSAAGQLFIFSTVSSFGPLVFTIISTIRQGFSVLLSCLIYNHRISAVGIFGIFLVFFSVLLRLYCGYRLRLIRKHAQNAVSIKL